MEPQAGFQLKVEKPSLLSSTCARVGMVDELMSGLITRTWERIESIVYEYRERLNWPQGGRSIEYLYNEKKRTAISN